MTDTPDEIARGLTDAQRRAIIFIGRGPYDHAISLFATFWFRPENEGLLRVIRDELKLTSTILADTGHGPIERLTPRGLAVRKIIQEQNNADDPSRRTDILASCRRNDSRGAVRLDRQG